MQSESTNLEKSLLNHLGCLIRMEYMRPPIILYGNGHSICNICKPKMNHSPTCKEKFLNTRNLALEDRVCEAKYPCKYQAYRYMECFNCDMIVGHQAKCRYCLQVCPAAKLEIGRCSWTGSYDFKGHLKEDNLSKF